MAESSCRGAGRLKYESLLARALRMRFSPPTPAAVQTWPSDEREPDLAATKIKNYNRHWRYPADSLTELWPRPTRDAARNAKYARASSGVMPQLTTRSSKRLLEAREPDRHDIKSPRKPILTWFQDTRSRCSCCALGISNYSEEAPRASSVRRKRRRPVFTASGGQFQVCDPARGWDR